MATSTLSLTLLMSISITHFCVATAFRNPSLDIIDSTPVNHSVIALFTSEKNGFDAPYLSGVNDSVFEW